MSVYPKVTKEDILGKLLEQPENQSAFETEIKVLKQTHDKN